MRFCCPERLRDFFGRQRLHDFFVPRGCVIFLGPERLHDFFVPRDCVIFFGPERFRYFFFVPRGSVTFFLSREVP